MGNDRPDAQVASRDCHQCKKSRRKCDRTIPECQKCISREIQCPGFDNVQLKWVDGLTKENGKFSGQSVPEHWKLRSARKATTSSRLNGQAQDTGGVSSSDQLSDDVLIQSLNTAAHQQQLISLASHPCPDFQLVKEYSSSILFENLLSHFSTKVVPRLTWIDLSEHPWRSIILSLAKDCLSLRLSIGCLAAAHLSTTSLAASTQQVHLLQMCSWFRDACLRILSETMRRELQVDQTTMTESKRSSHNFKIIQVLATMLVLCYAGAVVPGSSDWAIHLGACRTVIDTYNLQHLGQKPADAVDRFLLKEVADLETLSSISVFSQRPLLDADDSFESTHSSSFWSFTDLINEITKVERTLHAQQDQGQTAAWDMPYWHDRAETAYSTVLANITEATKQQEASHQRLESALRSHYYANIIYSHQAFNNPRDAQIEKTVSEHLELLFQDLEFTLSGPVHEYTHTIFFPLLIAGTECRADKNRQDIIGRLFMESLTKTGMWFNHTALKFLHSFWESSDHDESMTWIRYARENEAEIGTFIAY